MAFDMPVNGMETADAPTAFAAAVTPFRIRRLAVLSVLAIGVVLSACSESPAPIPTPTVTPVPTSTPTPTASPAPMPTITPAPTPSPTATLPYAAVWRALSRVSWLEENKPALAEAIRSLPWVGDGIGDAERQAVQELVNIEALIGSESTPTIVNKPWVEDGLDEPETALVQELHRLSSEGESATLWIAALRSVGGSSLFVVDSLGHRYDANNSGSIEHREAVAAVTDYLNDELSRDEAVEIIALYGFSEALIPTPSLVEIATASDWYRDGLDHASPYRAEPRALRVLEQIDRNNPELARLMSRWAWLFDEDMRPRETDVVEYIAALDEKVPEFVPRIVGLPWIQDGIDRWESSAASDLYTTAIHYDPDFAVELATAPWVVDGVTLLEGLFGIGPLSSMSGEHERDFFDVRDGRQWTVSDLPHGPELARQIMSLIDYPPKDIDLYLVSALNDIRQSYPGGFGRLLAEPWFVDGLDKEERIYLIAASGAERWDELFEPYTVASATIALPHTGAVNLWAVQHGQFPSGPSILAQVEEAVRGSEQFWELPFPVDDVILFLEDRQKCHLKGRLECRGKHIGRLMFLYTDGGNLSSGTVNHEVAHYYFLAGPSWFAEGGAEFVTFYLANDGNVPVVEFPDHCAEQGFDNLQALNDVGGGPAWDACRYHMGLHFLTALRETMGEDAWLSALRAFYKRFGYEELYVSTSDSPRDEEVYQVFLEHTPPELLNEVRDVFRRLHGGPFVDAEK